MFSKKSYDEQVRNVEEFLESRFLKSGSGGLTEEEIKEKKQEIETMAPAVAHLASIQVRKLKGLNQIADKLQRRGLGALSSLVLGIEDSKVTEKDIVDLSIQVDKSLNQGMMKPSSIEDCINSFIVKINSREEEQRQELEKIRQEKLVAQQQVERERQEKLVAQQQVERERQEKLVAQQEKERERQEKLAAQQNLRDLAEEQKKLKVELAMLLGKKSETQDIEVSRSDHSSAAIASTADSSRMCISESSKPFLPLNATHERKRKISSSSDSEAEERRSPSLRGTSTTAPNTPSSDK